MFRFSLFRGIRTDIRALPPRRTRRGCRPNLETLEDRSVPATFVVATQGDLGAAILQSNTDASNHVTTAGAPDVIQWATPSTPVPLENTTDNTGFLEIDGDLVLDVSSTLTNEGTLTVTGNVQAGASAALIDSGTAQVAVTGNIIGDHERQQHCPARQLESDGRRQHQPRRQRQHQSGSFGDPDRDRRPHPRRQRLRQQRAFQHRFRPNVDRRRTRHRKLRQRRQLGRLVDLRGRRILARRAGYGQQRPHEHARPERPGRREPLGGQPIDGSR